VVTSPLSYCQYAPAGALSASGQNLKWYTSLTGGSGTTVAPVPSTSASGTKSWFVSQTVNGCESDRAIITVIINAKPSAPVVATPVLYCKDDPAIPLTAQGQGLLWYTSSTGGIGSPTSPTPSTTTTGSTYFYVSQSVLGCESDRSAIEVQVNDKRDITLTLDKQSVCQYDTVVASAIGTNPPGTNYLWSFDGGTVLSGTGIGPYLIKWTSPGTKTVIVSSSDAGCIAVDTAVITVSPAPSASFVLESDACLGEQISVQAAWGNLGNSAYTWDFGDAIVINGSGPGAYKIKWNEVGPHVVSLVTLEKGCPSEIFYDTIIVHPDPVAKIEAEKTGNVCSGDLIKLNALNSSGNNNYNYLWSPKEYFTLAGLQNTVATVKATGFIKLLVEDPYGCTGTDSIFIQTKPCCDIHLPDAFSPNGDGLNDVFRAITLGHHKLTDFRIMNRWGQAVYVGGDIKFGWDGTVGGKAQPIGTYFYYLRYQCGTGEVIEKKGELTLIR
jgi:gliding motility-associated-like protein